MLCIVFFLLHSLAIIFSLTQLCEMIRSMAEVYTLCILSDVGYSVGNYMQMMIVLKPIAFDVIIYMTQLFDYYLYAVNIHIL